MNAIVKLCVPKSKTTLEQFQELVSQCALWTTVLKSEGSMVHKVTETEIYKVIVHCLERMVAKIKDGDIPHGYLTEALRKTNKNGIIDLLLLVTKYTKTDIERYWDSVEGCFESELEKITASCDVLKEIQNRNLLEKDSCNTKKIVSKCNELKKNILMGAVNARQLRKGFILQNDVGNIPEKCLFLQQYVTSGIFWNSAGAIVKTEFEKERVRLASEEKEREAFESIHRLFGEYTTDGPMDKSDISEIDLFIEILTNKGIFEYKQAWTLLIKDQDKDVSYVITLLHNVDVDKEIEHAVKILRQPIPDTLQTTLRHLYNINQYDYMVNAITKCLGVFGISADSSSELNDAICTFENIIMKNERCPFSAVVKSLQKIDSFFRELLSETIDILSTLGGSSSLIEFLRKIIDEDIRNLIDAVEDISEQHVQESTVSALIEVKSFLHGLLVRTPCELSAQEFLETLNKQAKSLSANAAKLPAKINECMNSLHNLISLYENVANRGEMTAEIIINTVSKGKFKFELEKGSICKFYATYKHGSIREKQTQLSLIDLRSRALLLMNTRTKTHESKIRGHYLEKFVSYIDLCMEIGVLIDELHQSGHMDFMIYSKMTECSGLADLQKELRQKKVEWNTVLLSLRKEFYLLNFIHGPEIHLLSNCFEKQFGQEQVSVLLRYIHPELKLDVLLDIYAGLKGANKTMSNEETLRCFGQVLHLGYEDKHPIERSFPIKGQSKRLTEVVQNRQLFVAALEVDSNQVVKTMLALYMNTTHTLPEPHQVLFCTKRTTWNELELLLSRCFGSFKFSNVRQLFCIAQVEMLSSQVQFKLVEKLQNINTDENYLLSLICRGSGKHPFLDELSSGRNKLSTTLSDEQLRQAFQTECPRVVTYTSAIPGLGKSSKIKESAFNAHKAVITLHLSGPLDRRNVIERLSTACLQSHNALHIDLGNVDNMVDLDTFIFELIILRYVTENFKSFSLETEYIYIEVGNTINDLLRNSLSTVVAFKREHLKWGDYTDYHISMEVTSPVQVVCQYLNYLDKGLIDRKDLQFSGQVAEPAVHPNDCRRLLRKYYGQESDLSFTVVKIFLHVLADQLKKMACSSFFRVSRLLEMTDHKTELVVRSTLVKALIEASKEFSLRSIKTCKSSQVLTVGARAMVGNESVTQTSKRSQLIDIGNQIVDAMVRWEDNNHLMFVFHSQNVQTISCVYRDLEMVPSHIKTFFESQMKRKMQDISILPQTELMSLLQKVARTSPMPLCANTIQRLNAEYALTPDNLLKMILIMLRINSHIPVIVMGETGCGKTSLIRYLATVSDVEFEVLSIHAGTEEALILKTIRDNNEKAFLCPNRERWLFLDEINTSEHIGVICDAICGRACHGKILASNLIVMGACNPYKLRTESAISTAGLKGKIQTDELSKLVYRVLPLPERLIDYVWDFGTLSDKDEALYIRRMIDGVFPGEIVMLRLLQDLLSASQQFVRKLESVSYCVSLRDVQRCIILIKWFLETLPMKGAVHDVEITSVILALAVCYHSRFSSNKHRMTYRKELHKVFIENGREYLDDNYIKRIIIDQQNDVLERMDLPTGIAKNTALKENVFVILVCLLNKIPIFLVGKPGCSKSLSIQVIRNNLRGKDSKDTFFKSLPQLYCVSFQGSQSSTSDGIIKVFEKAIKYQESNLAEEVLSVVILDEIGLAEVSKFNPLKVLHSLLEPDGRPQPDVAVVGVSNWALDASKMNRGIHISRPDMDEEELFQTGVSISHSFIDSKKQKRQNTFSMSSKSVLGEKAEVVLKDIAMSYLKYVNKLTFKNFHGLRDYYSLVKYISRSLVDEGFALDDDEKENMVFSGLQRNFGGLPAESATLLDMFQIQVNRDRLQGTNVLKLMADNINDSLARHLMCITSGDSVISLVENLLTDINRYDRIVIFGSHFEEDQTADYCYRILSRIILCMEQGFVLILKDLENIYGSLYDMLNQNYTVIGKKKHCRVALGHYSNPICHVHDNFRCIVLVDESKVDYSDPPFLNRFEKQYLRFTDTVDTFQADLIRELENWIKKFSYIEGHSYDETDCFPIYSQDMIPSLVIKTCRECGGKNKTPKLILETCQLYLLLVAQPDSIFRLENSSAPEMRKHAKRIMDEYLKLPIHRGIWEFIDHQMNYSHNRNTGLLTIVLTNSSIHSLESYKRKKDEVQVEKLAAFKSEKQLHLHIQNFWTEAFESILFLHCCAAEDEKLISLAKTTIDSVRADSLRENRFPAKHVYFIIHLDRRRRAETTAFLPINYLSGWEIVTLDSLKEPEIPLMELFTLSLQEAVERKRPLTSYISGQLFWSFSRIRYGKLGRDLESIQKVIHQLQNSEEVLEILEELVYDWIKAESKRRHDTGWLNDIALNAYLMNTYSSFLSALEHEIFSIVSEPLCKIVYQMENMYMTSCYFCEAESHGSQRRELVKTLLKDQTYFSILGIHNESGPECYLCQAADLPLRMPLSKLIFDKVEETKEDFMETYLLVKGKCDLQDDDEMPPELLDVLFSKHEGIVEQILPEILVCTYDSVCDDYFHDFCYFVSYETPSRLAPARRHRIVRWSLEKEINMQTKSHIELIVKLHASYWVLSPALSAEYQLFESCSESFNMEETFLLFSRCQPDRELDSAEGNVLEDPKESSQKFEVIADEFNSSRMSKNKIIHDKLFISDRMNNFGGITDQTLSTNNQPSEPNISTERVREKNKFHHVAVEKFGEPTFYFIEELPPTTEEEDSQALSKGEFQSIAEDEEQSNTVDKTPFNACHEDNPREILDENLKSKLCQNNPLDETMTDIMSASYLTGASSNFSGDGVSHEKCFSEQLYSRETNCTVELDLADTGDLFQSSELSARADTITITRAINEVPEYRVLAQQSYLSPNDATGFSVKELNNELKHSNLTQKNTRTTDSREKLVKFVSNKMLPSKLTLDMFDSIEEWQRRVSSVLISAVKVSSDLSILHSLKFCADLASILGPRFQLKKRKYILKIGDYLQSSQEPHLDSPECFQSVYDLLYTNPKLPSKDAKLVLCSYLNRCLEADVDTQALSFFLQLIKDKHFEDSDFDVFKPAVWVALNLDTVDDDKNIFYSLLSVSNVELDEYPFLCLLDDTLKELKGTADMDSQFMVLLVDILEEIFCKLLVPDFLTTEAAGLKEVFLSVQNIILSGEFGIRFLVGIALYKSFIKIFANSIRNCGFDVCKCMTFFQVVKAVMDKESDNPVSLSMKRFFIKEVGKGMLPWNVQKVCELLSESFDFLKSWQWTENYECQCLEGNPLLRFAPKHIQEMEMIFKENDIDSQSIMLAETFKKLNDTDVTLAMYAVGLAKFYVTRSYKQQDDTFNQLAKAIICIAKKEDMDSKKLQFLACLLGVRLFPVLELDKECDEIHTATASFTTSLLALILSSSQNTSEYDDLPLLAKIIFSPCKVESKVMSFLRHLCNKGSKKVKTLKIEDSLCATCFCGYRVFSDEMAVGQHKLCPICRNDITSYIAPCKKRPQELPATTKRTSLYHGNLFCTPETEASNTIIHLCVHVCLLGSLAMKFSNSEEVERITEISEVDNILESLMTIAREDFTTLQRSLNMNCRELYIFLQACLLKIRQLLCTDKTLITTEEHVIEWAQNFELQIKSLIKDRYGSVQNAVKEQITALQMKCEGPELSVNENDENCLCSEVRIQFLPSLFRVQGQADFASFKLDVHLLADQENHPYPFLRYVLDVLPDLSLTEHIIHIVRWHVATVAHVEYRMKRRQCLEMTVEDFIHYDKDENLRSRLKNRFERLQESLAILMTEGDLGEILTRRLTSQTQMKNCLILDSSSVLHQVITELVAIHNKFLDTTLEISVKTNCEALQFLTKGQGISAIPCISLSAIKTSSLVSYHWEDELLKFSHADLRYGYGAKIRYEFQAIEKLLAFKLVAGKSFILHEEDLPAICFVDEFYKGYGEVAKEVSTLIPQQPLTLELVQGIMEKREKHPRLTAELITHTGVLIALAKKTKGDPMMPVVEYAETWKHVLTSPLPSDLMPAPENRLKLCHLIALYGLLEELNADSLVDSLDDEYRKMLTFDVTSQLSGLLRSNEKLAEMMLKAIKRFTYRCLSSGEVDSAQSLSEYLNDESFWPCGAFNPMEKTGDSQNTSIQQILEDLKVQHVYEMIVFMEDKLKVSY